MGQVTVNFLGTGTMVVDLKHADTMLNDRERLKICVNTSARWSAQAWSTHPCTPSGLADLCVLMLWSAHRTLWVWRTKVCESPDSVKLTGGWLFSLSDRAKKLFSSSARFALLLAGVCFVLFFLL